MITKLEQDFELKQGVCFAVTTQYPINPGTPVYLYIPGLMSHIAKNTAKIIKTKAKVNSSAQLFINKSSSRPLVNTTVTKINAARLPADRNFGTNVKVLKDTKLHVFTDLLTVADAEVEH